MNQVTHPCALEWSGLGVVVRSATLPRPPPTCPTMTMEVGTGVAVVAPVGVNERLFVRLIVKLVAVPAAAAGTVITTGDQVAGTGGVAAGFSNEPGFNAGHRRGSPATRLP